MNNNINIMSASLTSILSSTNALSSCIRIRLVKLVPAGGQPSASTGYWLRESELAALQKDPANIASRLGLPPGMHANQFDVYEIAANKQGVEQGVLIFESTIAPTTVDGARHTTGGARQVIVVNRDLFTQPSNLGPSVEQLRAAGKSWQQIIEGAAKPDGKGIDFSPPGFKGEN